MRLPLLFVALALATLTAPRAAAQGEALPDLTPREFEIQGDLQVDFSGIRRQPLSGFGPPPRAYVVPAERAPSEFVYGFPLEQIAPPTLPLQPIPKTDLLRPLSGYAEGLAGVYAARAARLRLQQSRATGALFLDVDYDGSSTYSPFDAAVSNGTAIYNRAAAAVGYRSRSSLRVEVGGRFVDHEVYGAQFATTASPAAPVLPDQPTRTTTHGYGEAAYGSARSPVAASVRYDLASTTTDLDGFALPTTPNAEDPSEGRVTAEGHATWRRIRIDAHGSLAGTGTALGSDVTGYGAGAALTIRASRRSTLIAGARLLGADGPLGSATAVGPVAQFELRPRRSRLRVFAQNDPRVVHHGLATLFEANPFAERNPLVMPEVRPLNARAGLQTQIGTARATLYGGAQWGDYARFFERDVQTGLFVVGYGEAQRFFGGAELAYGVPERLEATAGLEVRSGRLVEADADLPYYAPVVAHAAVTATLLDQRLRLSLQARAEGTRPADRAGAEAPGFFDLGLDVAYQLTEQFDVLVRGGGLGGEVERWEGYPEAPFTVLGGLRARW